MKRLNNELTHGIHPYHAKFIPSIPRDFLSQYSKPDDIVLDPFCGSGTTLLESMLMGRYSIGVDLSVLAYKISKAKTFIPNIEMLDRYFKFITEFDINKSSEETISFENKYIWYTKKNADILDNIFYRINKIDNNDYKNCFEILVSSILKTVSNKRKVWNNGYIADNVLPNIEYKGDILRLLKSRYKVFRSSYNELIDKLVDNNYKPEIINDDIMNVNLENKVDIIITSPPYPFAVDFVKYNRLSYYWLGYDVEEFAEKETGSRNKRNKANAVQRFYTEMEKIYLHLFSCVKQNGYFCMTVADTQRNNEKIKFVDWLKKLFLLNNWILISDELRELESQSMGQKRIQYEHKIVFKKGK